MGGVNGPRSYLQARQPGHPSSVTRPFPSHAPPRPAAAATPAAWGGEGSGKRKTHARRPKKAKRPICRARLLSLAFAAASTSASAASPRPIPPHPPLPAPNPQAQGSFDQSKPNGEREEVCVEQVHAVHVADWKAPMNRWRFLCHRV